ncbi:non-ribosomal peptide synthetase [Nocardiopsis sp. L17-MgMaSL7]|uniref:non-ribosomal peptide synthetase n=1 Tax=Nocardiopsis sp. L17-MgMaSL7 TaxID=1938893 RepID=UPI000D70932D|nr:non-ribosomal peptide synthetase [Nocardiopsis sp. L17-MgMaSL7]PWV45670.1 amino acid adenylation domain-containing protein [Nocardiopsis sp. L17-MgMaSL7]
MTTQIESLDSVAGRHSGARDLLDRLAEVPGTRDAVVDGDRVLTFDQLRAGAVRVARELVGRGIGRERVVALCMPRGADLVLGLIGTLTAGAAYLPVDPALPVERRRHLLEDAAADLVVVSCGAATGGHEDCGASDGTFPETVALCRIAPDGTSVEASQEPFLPAAVSPANLAYVIYTSGSTGRPKGVEVSRGSVSALLADLESEHLAGPPGGRVGWNASASFDASVQQWTRLCRGDTVVTLDDQVRSDPAAMAGLIREQRLTDLDITPSHADLLLDHLEEHLGGDRPGPLTLLVGGEPVSPPLWHRLSAMAERGSIRAVNVYGPTECTVDATAGWIDSSREPHIGRVLPGLELRLLDERLSPVPEGVTGEIYLAGYRVARGYRGAPGLTAQRFVPDVAAADGSRMYRTGDLARRLHDGRLEYLGRGDRQVKLRGFRIEPGEVEGVLGAHSAVAEVVVDLRSLTGGPALVAYYRSHGSGLDRELRDLAAASLPGYMEPAAYVELAEFPRTPSGKLDRAALPDPEPVGREDSGDEGLSSVEQLIARVWATVLGVPVIGAEDDFFRLGGHSLLAIKLVSQVKAQLGVKIPLKAVYENPKLRDLASVIESAN